MTELATCHTGTQAVVADTDGFVFESICKVVFALSHGSDKDADTFFRHETVDIVSDSYHIGIEAQCHFATVRRKMVCDGVLDDFEQLFLRVDGSNGELVQELDH